MHRTAVLGIWLTLFLATLSRNTAIAAEENDPRLPAAIEPIFRWLPPETETVIVSQAPFRLPVEQIDKRHHPPSLWESVQALPCLTLWDLHDGLLLGELKGKRILVAVEGSHHFRAPKDLGLMPYQGCQIIQFDEAGEEALVSAFQACLKAAKRSEQIGGQKVAVFQERREGDDWTVLVAQPRRGILLCATDRDYLAQVIQRMDGEPQNRALPPSLPEWEHVKTEAAVWGLRHYRKEDADKDPSSPLARFPTVGQHDGEAVGFVFWYDPDSDKRVELRCLSDAANLLTIAKTRWNIREFETVPVINEAGRGVVRIAYPTGKQDRRDIFLLLIMAYLGHGVHI